MSEEVGRRPGRLALPGLWLLLAACRADPAAAGGALEPPPNIVVVFTDDQGYADVGVQGAQGFETPNLDRLAREGARLTSFYVAQPVCSASRAALLSGCYPHRLGIHGALGPADTVGIAEEVELLPELLQERGYATACFGKWHLGHAPEHSPLRHGFDRFYGIPYSNDMWPGHPEVPKAWGDLPLYDGSAIVAYNPDQTRFTHDFTARAVQFIEENAERPFFVYLAHPMPHVPLHASAAWRGRSPRGLYGDVIEEIDDSVGTILATLERLGLERRTLVLFSSDNGPWLSYGEHAGSTGPLREGKGTTFEGGVRVPFLVRWPGHVPAGLVSDEPAMTIDVLPTLARLAGARQPARAIEGRDIWRLWSAPGAPSPHSLLYFYYQRGVLEALRSGRWKLHLPHGYRTLGDQPRAHDGIPAVYDYGAEIELSLYDLEADVGETTNVADAHPRIVALLEQAAARAAERDAAGAVLEELARTVDTLTAGENDR